MLVRVFGLIRVFWPPYGQVFPPFFLFHFLSSPLTHFQGWGGGTVVQIWCKSAHIRFWWFWQFLKTFPWADRAHTLGFYRGDAPYKTLKYGPDRPTGRFSKIIKTTKCRGLTVRPLWDPSPPIRCKLSKCTDYFFLTFSEVLRIFFRFLFFSDFFFGGRGGPVLQILVPGSWHFPSKLDIFDIITGFGRKKNNTTNKRN